MGGFPEHVCLWCNLRLPDERRRAVTRREYDVLHLLARSHSMYDRPLDEDRTNQAEHEAHWVSSLGRKRRGNQSIESFDPFERQRYDLLNTVSLKRSSTAQAQEDARWSQSESLRRQEQLRPPAPIRRQTTTPATENSRWCETDSMAPTLVERRSWESQRPPAYETFPLADTEAFAKDRDFEN